MNNLLDSPLKMPSSLNTTDQRYFLIASFVIVMILFFVDENYFDFRWMKSWGNWVVFFIYLVLYFMAHYAIAWLLIQGKLTRFSRPSIHALSTVAVLLLTYLAFFR